MAIFFPPARPGGVGGVEWFRSKAIFFGRPRLYHRQALSFLILVIIYFPVQLVGGFPPSVFLD